MKVLLTDNPEIESVAIIVTSVFEPTKVGSYELIVIELLKLNQGSCAYRDQLILVKMPAGFVKIVGSVIVRGVPI